MMKLKELILLATAVVVFQVVLGVSVFVIVGVQDWLAVTVAVALMCVISLVIVIGTYVASELRKVHKAVGTLKGEVEIVSKLYKETKKVQENLKNELKHQRKFSLQLLSDDERKVVSALMDGNKVKQSELAKNFGWSRGKMSNVVRELENRGIIKRKRLLTTHILELA